jgi:hypothetical protein
LLAPNPKAGITALTGTELAEEVREVSRRLTEAIEGLRAEVHGLRVDVAEIKTSLRWAKWLGTILIGFVLTGLWESYQAVRLVTRIENGLVVLQRDLAELKADTKDMRKDTMELKADFKSQSGQLDRIEKSLAQNRPSNPR